MEINIHGLELIEALDEISYTLSFCKIEGITEISIIHGCHHGQVLKNYIRSEGFLKEMKGEGYELRRKCEDNPGITNFDLL